MMSVSDGFSNTFKTPCVIFTGHPSLRFGDVVHFMEMWGSSSANTIIFTGIMLHICTLRSKHLSYK